jgi:geranylgeranyl pyrophosphate synthase
MRFPDWCAAQTEAVQATLDLRFQDAWPPLFQQAAKHPLGTGGKRIRPLFAFSAAHALGADVSNGVIAVGAAVELIHTYSLVHDDLPCMDDDDERRGQPATHITYGEAPALLVGDALLTEAFSILANAPLPPTIVVALIAELAKAAGHQGMIGGQAADIGMGGPVDDIQALMRLHRGKTGALILASVRLGGIAVGAKPRELDCLSRYGSAVGLAFQMADDVLDADEDEGDDGPPSYVKLMGIKQTKLKAASLLEEALDAASGLPHPEFLVALAHFTVDRDH